MVIKKTTDFELDGKGSATAWDFTKWENLTVRKGDDKGYETKVKVLYSETGMYFLFHCKDKKLTATMTSDFDNLYEEDVVEVFLWTDEGTALYFEYEVSPLNYELPILVPNFGGKFLGWLPWHYDGERKTRHETSIIGGKKESGAVIKAWMAEFFIPYSLLNPLQNVPPVSGMKWRANMYRIDYDNGQTGWTWQPVRTNFHDYERFGTFIFE
ncbi:MAG: carbohydrate-binding family 9-like protein [Cyclobacteriaceae bacterium]|nr:carbohydrate-binding family 9-like protein [Cyclobacteriaceae bacterium]